MDDLVARCQPDKPPKDWAGLIAMVAFVVPAIGGFCEVAKMYLEDMGFHAC